jgi:hypothetical protein
VRDETEEDLCDNVFVTVLDLVQVLLLRRTVDLTKFNVKDQSHVVYSVNIVEGLRINTFFSKNILSVRKYLMFKYLMFKQITDFVEKLRFTVFCTGKVFRNMFLQKQFINPHA